MAFRRAQIPPALKIDRHQRVLSLISSRKRLVLAALERALHVPRITVQRDLVELENRQLVRRFHGGAMAIDFSGDLFNYGLHRTVHVEAKERIAAKANGLLRANSVVCLDAGSTVCFLSESIGTVQPEELVHGS
jgi:DeoR/GlpR family transcriptional regulator of sugar metabolism